MSSSSIHLELILWLGVTTSMGPLYSSTPLALQDWTIWVAMAIAGLLASWDWSLLSHARDDLISWISGYQGSSLQCPFHVFCIGPWPMSGKLVVLAFGVWVSTCVGLFGLIRACSSLGAWALSSSQCWPSFGAVSAALGSYLVSEAATCRLCLGWDLSRPAGVFGVPVFWMLCCVHSSPGSGSKAWLPLSPSGPPSCLQGWVWSWGFLHVAGFSELVCAFSSLSAGCSVTSCICWPQVSLGGCPGCLAGFGLPVPHVGGFFVRAIARFHLCLSSAWILESSSYSTAG